VSPNGFVRCLIEVASVLPARGAGRRRDHARENKEEPPMHPIVLYLIVAAALFCIGVRRALRRNAIGILMVWELMLNA